LFGGRTAFRAQDRIKETIKQFPREPGIYNAETIRDAGHDFKVERHLFCVAAGQFFDHRRWLGRLGGFEEGVFCVRRASPKSAAPNSSLTNMRQPYASPAQATTARARIATIVMLLSI